MTLVELNRLSETRAEAEFLRCCGSHRWAHLMAAERPFAGGAVVMAVAQRLWWSLAVADWLEAFAAHPRIGDPATSAWSAQEQGHAVTAPADVRERLTRGNRAYEERFGYTFLVCATDKSAEEILATLDHRLHNEPGDELQIAADEQRKITAVRLIKLMSS
jgi:2-oxo-4-hydroxy-4-carboxy-5-ureidoimidazoline decarboxylase